jgi:predicted nuclease of predicted toxin-antitoxin system
MPRRRQQRIKFFIDHCVPDSVGRALRDAGHEVILLRDQLAPDSPDPLVAAVSQMFGAVLVSLDSDFRSLAPRIAKGEKTKLKKLSRIGLRCFEPRAANRIIAALSLIEHEWRVAQGSSDKRIIVEIGDTYIRTVR